MSILAALAGLAAAASAAAGGAVELTTPSTSVVLGEPVTVQAAALEPGAALALDLQASTTDSFAITSVRELEPAGRRFEVQLIPLDVGQRVFTLRWTVAGAGPARAASSELRLDVREPPGAAQAQDVKDIKPPRPARPLLWPWLLLSAALAALWYWHRRRSRRLREALAAAGPPPDNRPPEAIAESELAALEASRMWEEDRHKEFYGALTEILRRYLERRCAFPATRLTTTEIHRRLRQLEFDRRLLTVFKDLFDRADLVKFAKIPAQARWGGSDLTAARRLVRETSPKETAAAAPPPAGPAGGRP
ncbi:MAG: hypothetical protein PHU21_08790 [Elusimicrobia bacterium]|nr:hypothetical protein [Elusimicrobiota bacterium]